MERKPHIIQELKRGMSKLRLLFFDTETKTTKETNQYKEQTFILGYSFFIRMNGDANIVQEVERPYFNTKLLAEHVDFLAVKSETLRILSCNIWFDIRVSNLLVNLVKLGFIVKSQHVKQMCVIIRLEKEGRKILIMNINQFIPGSVKMFGELLGLPKMEIDLKNASIHELLPYCRRDAEIITRIFVQWLEFIHEHDLGKMGFTLASQAFIAYRHRFMKSPIYVHGDPAFTFFERAAYYGGRTEIFFQGKRHEKKTYYLDVNSMYPHIMKKFPIPYKVRHCVDGISVSKLKTYMKSWFCIAQVAITTDKPYYPVRHNNRLCFPTGKFVTVLAQPELELATQNKHVIWSYNVVLYDACDLFSDFVDFFYGLRQQYKKDGNKVYSYLTKRMMNSLYGKFGQRNDKIFIDEQTEEVGYESNQMVHVETGERLIETQMGHRHIIKKEGVLEANEAFPAICAAITSYARVLLLSYINVAGFKNVFYCDTDSIFVNEIGYRHLKAHIHPTRLGALGLEKSTEYVCIHGAKDYCWGGERIIKGLTRLRKQISSNSWEMLQFPGYKGDIQAGMSEKYQIKKITKTLKREYTKGIVHPNGIVTPLKLEAW
ncbi:MAG: DNA polymerase [Thermodesulfobacteriota bacterium]